MGTIHGGVRLLNMVNLNLIIELDELFSLNNDAANVGPLTSQKAF